MPTAMAATTDQSVRDHVRSLVRPERLRTSGRMTAILALAFNEQWTEPAIATLHITSDGFCLIERVGDVGANEFLGGESSLWRNVEEAGEAAGLTPDERAWLREQIERHVERAGQQNELWRPPTGF